MGNGKGLARRYLMLIAAAATVAVSAAAVQAETAGAQTVSASRAATGGIDSNALYQLCLTNALSHCLAWGSGNTIVLNSSGSRIEWKVVSNAAGDQTYEASNDLCLADAAYASGANNQVYATSNCFGNAFASWKPEFSGTDLGIDNNVSSLNRDINYYALTALNTRESAFLYCEPQEPDTWQNWSLVPVG